MVIESEKLIRLTKREAPSLSTKEAEHRALSEQIAEFLSRGREIVQVETGLSGEPFVPKRPKHTHDADLRRRSWNRSQAGK